MRPAPRANCAHPAWKVRSLRGSLATSHREKMEQWCGKAGVNWHEVITHLRPTNDVTAEISMFSISHVANGSDQNSNQVFYLLCNTLSTIKNNYPHVTGACMQSDGAGC